MCMYICVYMYLYIYIYIYTDSTRRQPRSMRVNPTSSRYFCRVHTNHEQALVCLFNRNIIDASTGRQFHSKIANNRVFL